MKCDVLVVGAGPAGSMAAKTAAEKGVDVILIERNKEIGYPVRCAEGINKFLFQDTGINKDDSFIQQKIDGTKIYFYDEIYELNSDQWKGFTVDRTIFDKYLAKLAENAGAKLLCETKAVGMKKEVNSWDIKVDTKNDFKKISAKIVIGADGYESNVGRWVGIKNPWKDYEVCKCYELFLKCPNISENDKFHIAFGEEFSGGYAWIFPKKKKANVGVGISKKNNAIDALEYFINKYPGIQKILGDNFSTIERRGGGIPMNGPIKIDELVTDGILLVGDAGGMVDPITGEGITPSMISGISAGETAFECIEKQTWKKTDLKNYYKNLTNKPYMNTTFGENMDALKNMKNTFNSLFSKKTSKDKRKEFISMIEELT